MKGHPILVSVMLAAMLSSPVWAQTKQKQDDLYVEAMRSALAESVGPCVKFGGKDRYNLIVEANPQLTSNIPSEIGPFSRDYSGWSWIAQAVPR